MQATNACGNAKPLGRHVSEFEILNWKYSGTMHSEVNQQCETVSVSRPTAAEGTRELA